MKRAERFLCIPVAMILLCCCLWAAAGAETIRECHRVTSTARETKQDNNSRVKLWQVETAHPVVSEEVNGIAAKWAEESAPDLEKAQNNGKKNSRLDVEIRYSRTGLRWMSFLVQARTTYHQQLKAQRFTTRTYNMETGERVLMTDLFDDAEPHCSRLPCTSAGWSSHSASTAGCRYRVSSADPAG